MRKKRIGRRQAIKTIAAGGAAAAAASLPAPWVRRVSASDTILLGVPSSLSTPYGVADDTDHLNGTILAQEEIQRRGRHHGKGARALRARRRQALPGELPADHRRVHRQEGPRDIERLPVRPDSRDGRVRQVQVPLPAGEHPAQRHRRLQGRSGEVQPRAADGSVGGQLRMDLPLVAHRDGARPGLEAQEPEDPHRRRAGRLQPDHSPGGAGSHPAL